jgi:hypothetical protein
MKRFLPWIALVLSSCVNPYTKFYQGELDARMLPAYDSGQNGLKIWSTDNFDLAIDDLLQKGYAVIGQSSFNAASDQGSEFQIREQANRVGAHVVLISSRYTNTVTGATPLILPQTTSSQSSAMATAFGPAGTVNVYGTGTTTTQGTQTIMMPYSVSRSDFLAVFLVKFKLRLGISFDPLDNADRMRLETNSGVKVTRVIDGSPAFLADIFPGDILLAFENEKIQTVEQFKRLLDNFNGKSALFRIDRSGKKIEKKINFSSFN